MNRTPVSYRTLAWALILGALAARILLAGRFLLAPDEANYWQWSRYLALGYHDHPPMIAWTIRLATALLGQVEWAVRLPTILAMSLGSAYIALLAARWYSWRTALRTALLTEMVLLINGAALIATPDGLLVPCWAGACYHAACALEKGRLRHWLATGLWFGLGLLSKYTMVLFPASLLGVMLASGEHRRQLATFKPWLGFLLGCLLFTPVLIWNSQNEWTTFRHVLYQSGADRKALITLNYVGDFLGTQLVLLTPVAFGLILAAWCRPSLRRPLPAWQSSFLLWMSLPGFLLFALLSLHVRVYGNWPAPVYATALVLIGALFSGGTTAGRLPGLWRAALVGAACCTLPVVAQVVVPILPLPLSLDRTAHECSGWDQLGREIHAQEKLMPRPAETFLFGLRYQYASELAFYVPGQPRTVSINRWTRPNVYDFWFTDEMLIGKDAIGLVENRQMAEAAAGLFRSADPISALHRYRNSPWFGRQAVETLYLVRGYGFTGGIRWQPADPADIRATSRHAGQGH